MWEIKIHKLVINKDLKQIDKSDKKSVINSIFKKLTLNPEKYGAPLRGLLKGFWKLKVSHYRLVYKIEKKEVKVLVLKIGMRKDDKVYKEMLSRLKNL